MRTFVLGDLHGQHLWGIERIDQTLTLRWADPGGAVETIVRRMADVATAVRVEEGLIARRRSEGYRESDTDVFPPPSPRDWPRWTRSRSSTRTRRAS